MAFKSYYLVSGICDGECHQAAQILRNNNGVVLAQPLQGSPDVVILVEAPERKKLVELTYRAFNSLNVLNSDYRFLPVSYD